MKIRPKLITFDFGDTLVSSDPAYLSRIWMGLLELGIKKSRTEVARAYHMADWKVSRELLKNGDYMPIVYQVKLGKGLLAELGIKSGKEKILGELYRWLVGFRPERVMVPGADKLLAELKRRRYKMGIVSNNDGNTRDKCKAVGIESYFDFILDSTIEGMVKPDPRFFRKALDLAGTAPETSLHIGDLWGSDILGARASGLWTIWIKNRYVRPGRKAKVFRISKPEDALKFIE